VIRHFVSSSSLPSSSDPTSRSAGGRSGPPASNRFVLTAGAAAACLGAATGGASPALAALVPVGTGPESAAVVVNFSDGAVGEFLVSYGTATTTGEQLLTTIDAARSDFTVTGSGTGPSFFVQQMSYAGHSDGPAFVPPEGFWHYWTRSSATAPWVSATVGAGSRTVDDGYQDGWVFGRATAPVPEAGVAAVGACAAAGLLALRRRRAGVAG
jgi:hypothetical protein